MELLAPRGPTSPLKDKIRLFATTSRGLESALREEIEEICEDTQVRVFGRCVEGVAGVSLTGTWETVMALNMSLKCASRLLWVVGETRVASIEDVHGFVASLPWWSFFGLDKTFAVTAQCRDTFVNNGVFLSLKVKDALCDAFRARLGARPSVRVNGPDVSIQVRLTGHDLTVSIDTSGEPLSHRGYRLEGGEAPLSEALAAGCLRLAGWNRLVASIWGDGEPTYFERVQSDSPELLASRERRIPTGLLLSPYLLDPMTGSGTLVIEAAQALLKRRPNARREGFAYRALLGPESASLERRVRDRILAMEGSLAECFARCEQYARNAGIVPAPERGDAPEPTEKGRPFEKSDRHGPRLAPFLIASDHNRHALDMARRNAQEAGVARLIGFRHREVTETRPHASRGMIVVNPPYGLRLSDPQEVTGLYRLLGDTWKREFPHWTA